ncbi:MAG: hypothetical protein IOD12_16470 [Silvanigrellales bacterium]|nr:hypothetical protein [Silvanigrellales bacterium]
MAELGLFPDPKILVIQGVIFIGALASANHFIIKPALRLHNERRKRTSGAVDGARNLELRAEALETAYETELKARNEEARNLRLSEVLAGQAEAESILSQAHHAARDHVESIQTKLDATVKEERARLPALVDSVAESILKQLGAATALTFGVLVAFASSQARAAGGAPVDVWYSIFWPYFQFLCFVAALTFFGRKVMAGILESRRDVLRTKLSEAKQAVTLAERKAQEYEARMENLQKEVASLIAQRVEDGVRERNKIVADAQAVAATLVRDAERAAKELVTKAREELRKDLVSMAVDAVDARLSGEKAKALDVRLKNEALQGVSSLRAH